MTPIAPSDGKSALSSASGVWRALVALALLVPAVTRAQQPTVKVATIISGSEVTYGAIGAIRPTRDGGVAVTFPQERVIRFFAANGNLLSETGQRGAGPADFATLTAFGTTASGFWVFDRNNARFSMLTATGKPSRTVPMPTSIRPRDPATGEFNLVAIHGVAPGDTMLVAVQRRSPVANERIQALFRMSPAGQLVEEVIRVPADPCFQETTVEGQLGSVRIPFCVAPLLAVSPNGSRVVALRVDVTPVPRACLRTRLVGGPGATTEHCLPFTPEVTTIRQRDSAGAELVAKAPHPDLKRAAAAMTGIPTTHPPYTRALLGDDGVIWLQEGPSAKGRVWAVVDGNGQRIGAITLAKNIELRLVSRDRSWGVRTDDDGIEDLVQLDVRWR